MPIIFGKAPGKIILFGEHAVVYGQPAIAIPVMNVNATAKIFPEINAKPGSVHLHAPEIHLDAELNNLPDENPLAAAVHQTLEALALERTPAITIQISSTIPVSAGMGSSAAISIAIIKALSAFLGSPLPPEEISDLAYEVEKLHHGTPSGIDNNVIAHQKPVYFKRNKPIEFLNVDNITHWMIADTGEQTPTYETVSAVRALHAADSETYDHIFGEIGALVQHARPVLIQGDLTALGWLMNENQRLLEKLNVSSRQNERLVQAARKAGAAGAKLSGGGQGGNIIALSAQDRVNTIEEALIDAGAVRVIKTRLMPDKL